jgi:hypothetical protein
VEGALYGMELGSVTLKVEIETLLQLNLWDLGLVWF